MLVMVDQGLARASLPYHSEVTLLLGVTACAQLHARNCLHMTTCVQLLARDCLRVLISAMGHHVPNLSEPRAAPHGNREPHQLDNIKVSFTDAIRRRGDQKVSWWKVGCC